MSAARSCVRPLALAVWLGLLFCAPSVQAQDDAAFKAGLDARQDKKWQEAAAQMRRAIQANPKEDTRKVTRGIGRVFGSGTEYLPYYFLGEALYNLGDCAGAVEAWGVSEAQRAVLTRPESVALIQKGYAACEAKGVLLPGKFDPLLSRTRQQVTEVTQLAGAISNRGQANIELWRSRPEHKEQYDHGSNELQNAQARLAVATRTRSERDFGDAVAAAERARTIFKALETQLNAAIDLQASVANEARAIEQIVRDGDANDRAIDGKKAILTPALALTRQSANEALKNVRTQLASGVRTSSLSALKEARTVAQDSSTKLKQVLEEVTKLEKRAQERRVEEAMTQAQEAFSFVDGGFATLDRLATEKPTEVRPEMAGERESLQKQVASLRRRFETARKNGDVSGLQDAARLAADVRTRLDTLIQSFGPVTLRDRGVHAALEEGARLFFSGEYQSALAALDPAGGLNDVPLQLHVHLLRAASLYALFVRSGEANQAQRTQAIAEIERCKQLNPSFQPDPRAFAPPFITFFQNGGVAATPAASATPRQQ